MFHILFSIIFCGCFYIFHMLNSHDRSCMISQHTFHTISHTFHSFTYLFHSIWWCEKEDIISHGFHMVISHYFSQMCEIVCEKPNENFTCTSHAFHIISSSSVCFPGIFDSMGHLASRPISFFLEWACSPKSAHGNSLCDYPRTTATLVQRSGLGAVYSCAGG